MKVKDSAASKSSEIAVNSDLQNKIEQFKALKAQMKEIEAKFNFVKQEVSEELSQVHAERLSKGIIGNFKAEGVNFICMDKSSGIIQPIYDQLVEKYGKEVVEELVEIDIASFKLNPEAFALESNAALIEKELDKLSKKIGVEILQAGVFRTKKGIFEKIISNFKKAKDIKEVIESVKLTKQLR